MNLDSVLIKAFGKVNLALNVGGTRPDGFHEVAMILQSVDLYDEIELTKADTEKVKILVDPARLKLSAPVRESTKAVVNNCCLLSSRKRMIKKSKQ